MSYSLEQNWIFTFGCGQRHAGHYVKIFGTFNSARDEMIRRYGTEWCFQYTEEEFFNNDIPSYLRETELIEENDVEDSEILQLYHGMSGTMQTAILDIMRTTQINKENK